MDDHWVFVILDFSRRVLVVFDSSPGECKINTDDLALYLKSYMECRDNNLGCSSSKKTNANNWIGFDGECSKQKDGNNCGIFVIEVNLFHTKQ